MIAGASLLLLTLHAQSGMVIHAPDDCPSADRIRDNLQRITPAEESGALEGTLIIHAQAETMRVWWASASGPVHERRVEMPTSCEERAEAVAVIFASWRSAPAGKTLVAPGVAVATTAQRPSPSRRWSAALGWFGGFDGRGVPMGATADLSWSFAERWGVRAGLRGAWPRLLPIAGAQTRWGFFSGGLGMTAQVVALPPWELLIDAGPTIGLAMAQGRGLTRDESDTALLWGAELGGRLHRRLHPRVRGWLDLRVLTWGTKAHVIVNDAAGVQQERASLPRAGLFLGAGVAY